MLGARLATIHNLHYYLTLMREMREAIAPAALAGVSRPLRRRRARRLAEAKNGGSGRRPSGIIPPLPRHSFNRWSRPCSISPAYAQATGAPADAGIMNIGMLVLMLVVFWFILIRPQMKRAKEHKAMIEALEKGAEVVTAGGVVGRITKIGDGYVTLEIAPTPRSSSSAGRPDAAAEGHDEVAVAPELRRRTA